MKFTPNYNVSYHGEFHAAGIPFDIDEKDVIEMSAHGIVYKTKKIEKQTNAEKEVSVAAVEPSENEKDEKADNQSKRGRPRSN